MNILLNLALVAQILSAIALVVIILVQHGKGADMGAAFGSGGSGSLFGASGSANFLSHATAILAVIFLGTTLALAHFGYSVPSGNSGGSVLDRAPVTAPAAPASTPPSPTEAAPATGAAGAAGAAAQIPEAAAGTPAKPEQTPAPAEPSAAGGATQIPTK